MYELNQKEIDRFKELWHNQTGQHLSDEMAQSLGSTLVSQVACLYDLP